MKLITQSLLNGIQHAQARQEGKYFAGKPYAKCSQNSLLPKAIEANYESFTGQQSYKGFEIKNFKILWVCLNDPAYLLILQESNCTEDEEQKVILYSKQKLRPVSQTPQISAIHFFSDFPMFCSKKFLMSIPQWQVMNTSKTITDFKGIQSTSLWKQKSFCSRCLL